MIYEFIIDASREDKDQIYNDLQKKVAAREFSQEPRFYLANNREDAERHVRMSCFLLPKEEICFVSCGNLTGQVASGLVGYSENKCMAILDYDITDDVLKSFPGLDFKDFDKMLDGEVFESDMIKVGDDYSLNVCTVGLSAMMAKVSREISAEGMANSKSARKALLSTLFQHRFNHVSVIADGKHMNGRFLLCASFSNGQWFGYKYHDAPEAVMNDGLLDVVVLTCVPLLDIAKSIGMLVKGNYFDSAFGRRHSRICKAKHIELDSDRLMYIAYDGQINASRHFDIDVIPSAVKIIIPKK